MDRTVGIARCERVERTDVIYFSPRIPYRLKNIPQRALGTQLIIDFRPLIWLSSWQCATHPMLSTVSSVCDP